MNSISAFQQARKSRDPRFDGRFFVGVKTTGIFCRNICPVKMPKEENVTYFELAAQAMNAGFRPCLRCRPDSAPHSFAWKGVETTLFRAMKLLKERPEEHLQRTAERLGISDGYLRKLFREKLGISPKQYQLTEQLLFAKRLLHETNLTVEQIAQSSGFNSSRRLQENFRDNLKLTPSQVRANSVSQRQAVTLKLAYREPYNWSQVRDFLAFRAINGVEAVTPDSYSRNFRWGKTLGNFVAHYNPQERCFDVTFSLSSYEELGAIVRNVKRVLDLEVDSQLIANQLIAAGFKQEQLVEGLRLPGVWSLFEAGCRAIIGQQVSVKAAITQTTRLVEGVSEGGDEIRCFPTSEEVVKSDLAFLAMPESRKLALMRFAEFMVESKHKDNPQDWLQIKGIGPWTVAYAQMRGLSDPDVWLNTDLVVKKQLEQHQVDAEKVAPWRSYLTFQLWSMAS